MKRFLQRFSSSPGLMYVAITVAVSLFTFALWAGIHQLGKMVEPTVLEHEQEHAHCYTAGKMFFVSIACVPKN